MTGKELMYVEDALGHAQFLMEQSQQAASMLQDEQLRAQVQQLTAKHQQIFRQFYHLV